MKKSGFYGFIYEVAINLLVTGFWSSEKISFWIVEKKLSQVSEAISTNEPELFFTQSYWKEACVLETGLYLVLSCPEVVFFGV